MNNFPSFACQEEAFYANMQKKTGISGRSQEKKVLCFYSMAKIVCYRFIYFNQSNSDYRLVQYLNNALPIHSVIADKLLDESWMKKSDSVNL